VGNVLRVWSFSADNWDTQVLFFVAKGYRVIAHDRRGHGRSGQVSDGHGMDHYAADAAALIAHLDLRDAIHIGHSTGGGEATALRRAPRQGPCRQARAHRRRTTDHAEDTSEPWRPTNLAFVKS
jgi:non-heme chloroperoxidase